MKLKIITNQILFLAILMAATGCTGERGWPPAEKDKLISSCVGEAKAGAAGLDESKIKNYCLCYQQNLEKTFPNFVDLKNVNGEDVGKAAEKCLELMFK